MVGALVDALRGDEDRNPTGEEGAIYHANIIEICRCGLDAAFYKYTDPAYAMYCWFHTHPYVLLGRQMSGQEARDELPTASVGCGRWTLPRVRVMLHGPWRRATVT